MAHDESPVPVSMLLGPSGLGTSAVRIPGTPRANPCSGGLRLPVGDEAAAVAATAPVETVRSVASALLALTLTDDPSVQRSLPDLAERIQQEMRRMLRAA